MTIFEYIDKTKDEIVAFTQELIRIPTVNPPGENYERIVAVLEKKCKAIGFRTKRVVVPKNELKKLGITEGSPRISLLAKWSVGPLKTLHFNGHYDVVPVTSNWSIDPFKAITKGGKIFGRGAEDMKSGIAAMIFAAEAVRRSGKKPKINVEFSFTPDEEIGGWSGLGYLVEKKLIRPDFAVGEGYSERFASFGNKGVLWIEVEVLGKSCHASEPYMGVNSFEKMLKVARRIEKLKEKIQRRKTSYGTKRKEDKFASMVLGGQIRGGNKINIVPDRSVFTIDCRILPEESIEDVRDEILEEIRKLKREDKQLRVKTRVLAFEPPVIVNEDEDICRQMKKAIQAVVGKSPSLAVTPGGTDMRFLIRKGIPTVGYSPRGEERAHADDEFIYIKSLLKTTKVFAYLIMNM